MFLPQLSEEQEREAKLLELKIRHAVDQEIADLARLLVSKSESDLFGATEFQVRDLVLRVGAQAFAELLREKKNGYRGCSVVCRGCGQSAEFQGYRPLKPLSILGPIPLQRAYYYCHRCGGQFPWDETVGLTPKRLTPAAEELTTLAGTTGESFQEAAENLLPKMASIRLSESTVQRTSEAAGQRLRQLLQEKKVLGAPTPWTWHKDARGISCAYVSIDATGVRQQGKGGKAAEGRMPYVAMVFNPVPDLPAGHPHRLPATVSMQARYLSGLYTLEELGVLLRRQAGQVGMNHAQQWIGLSDGGNGLENFLRANFPGPLAHGTLLELILDFWHAADSLLKLAKTIHPTEEERRQELVTSWCHTMKHDGGSRIVSELAQFRFPHKAAVRMQHEETVGYLTNNVHRMDYPRYLANGWCIGSGAMESACKTVVGQRLKPSGMRWGEKGTDDMCQLRALYRSESKQWELFWARNTA